MFFFRTSKFNISREINHELEQGKPDIRTQSHTFLCVHILWYHHTHKCISGSTILLSLSQISLGKEQRRDRITIKYS